MNDAVIGVSTAINSLSVFNDDVHAGTDFGIFRYNSADKTWTNIGSAANGLTHQFVYSLFSHGGTIYAGTFGGIFQYDPGEKRWSRLNTTEDGLSFTPVATSFAASGSVLHAGTYYGGGVLAIPRAT